MTSSTWREDVSRGTSLPSDVTGITPEWLTEALQVGCPDVVVTGVHVGTVIERFAVNVRIMLEYNDAGHRCRLPPTMYVKGAFGRKDLDPIFVAAFAREVVFYRDVAPEIPIDVPRCYFAASDVERGESVLLLEDLLGRNARLCAPRNPADPALVESALDLLARLHAYWWEHPRIRTLELYPGTLAPAVRKLFEPARWNASLARPCGRFVPDPFRDADSMAAAVEKMWTYNAQRPHCFIHGDVHLGNSFVNSDGGLGLFDWQAASAGSWAYDVTRLISGSMAIDDRRIGEQRLLRHYLEGLEALGVNAPRWDDAWLAYRRNLAHGLRWITCLPGTYPEVDVSAYVERHAAAVNDLDAFDALD